MDDFGLFRATVIDVNDPDSTNRVRLMIPQLFGGQATTWACPVLMNQGSAPALGEQVFASFEGGNSAYPVYLWFPAPGSVMRPGSAALVSGVTVHATAT